MNAPPLEILHVYLTRSCNLQCEHCWINASRTYPMVELEDKYFLIAFNEALDLGLDTLFISGGEPLLRSDLAITLIKVANNSKVKTVLETNGTLITPPLLKELAKYEIDISLSLDFPSEVEFNAFRHGKRVYRRVLDVIPKLRDLGIPPVVVVSVFNRNLHSIFEITDLIMSLGAKAVKFNPILPIGRARHNNISLSVSQYQTLIEYLIQLYDKYPGKIWSMVPHYLLAKYGRRYLNISRMACNYTKMLGILPDGGVSLCGIGIEYPETVIGNIKEESLRDIWYSGRGFLGELRRVKPDEFQGICSGCILRSYCANICPAFAYEEYKSFTASFPVCQKLFEEGVFPHEFIDPSVLR
ncbi:radical SAM protein [Thermococcus bergensis]|uniref:radical SAM/SPASM domain-containing protein n=1 Tax=Thermococcus bergensis TaxID=2689387 RepID=UPI001CEDE737|nr:radical SAM protein [Thermococcus bergensis]MCA6214231.1 radical SAM protein [Thermococcus bergensis]